MENQDRSSPPDDEHIPGLSPADSTVELPPDALPPGVLSPIRPTQPQDDAPPKPHLVPAKPDTGALAGQKHPEAPPPPEPPDTGALGAVEQLREKMAQAAREFAEGKLNRAQFYAIYARYNEQRTIVERLIARDPDSQAWQQVTRPGHTAFLRQHFEARILSFAIYSLGQTVPIVRHDTRPSRLEVVFPVLRALPDLIHQRGPLGPARKAMSSGQWLALVPGQYTVSVVIYSLEPSAQQMAQITDLHHDFERANIHALDSGDHTAERLVFPQRALFEGQEPI